MKYLALAPILFAIPLFAGSIETAAIRKEHVEIKEHLGHLDVMAGALATQTPEERQRTMNFIVKFLNEHIRQHADWEEANLYPAVDKRTLAGKNPFTATMRHEHRIIGRSIDGLEKLAADPNTDATTFTRAADRLLGLIAAHFEEEEEVLLPILDSKP